MGGFVLIGELYFLGQLLELEQRLQCAVGPYQYPAGIVSLEVFLLVHLYGDDLELHFFLYDVNCHNGIF